MNYNDIKPSQITRKQINDYIMHLIRDKHITESYQNQIASAIKIFYSEVFDQSSKVEGLVQAKNLLGHESTKTTEIYTHNLSR